MLGRGVKRKWSCLEDLEDAAPGAVEEKAQPNVPAPAPDVPMATAGIAQSKSQQRQVVLGLCLEKLQAGVELSLRRSVLLINTLRQLQEDMQSEGEEVQHHHCLLTDNMEEDRALTCPDCVGAGDTDALADGPSLLPDSPPSGQEAAVHSDQKPLPPVSVFNDAVNAMGYLSDLALDDIFEDIDTSMYESSDLSCAWASGVSALWADDDNVKVKPQGALQACISDLNELDHIMEILVKS